VGMEVDRKDLERYPRASSWSYNEQIGTTPSCLGNINSSAFHLPDLRCVVEYAFSGDLIDPEGGTL
jgi:hypothetical protein